MSLEVGSGLGSGTGSATRFGRIKVQPSDFVVEELPAYLPSGEGEHLFLWIEKEDHDTAWVERALAKHLGISPDEIGHAGLKDRRAVTRQWLSVPARAAAALETFAEPGVHVLSAERHKNKLKTGHLRGNRFEIRVREVPDPASARERFERVLAKGLPNLFGAQRFGRANENAALGKKLLLDERLPRRPDRFHRKLYLSAYQSLLFNRLLEARIASGRFDRVLEGDVLRKSDSGGLFVCTDPSVDQPRYERFEVSPTGPLYGPKMVPAEGEVGAAERAVLSEEGLTLEHFARGKGETQGTRRPFRVPVSNGGAEVEGSDLLLRFELPEGSYATVLLEQVLGGAPTLG